MLSSQCVRELQTMWLPHITDTGLNRLVELLESGSPYLITGCFTRATPMGCLATHAAWHHPKTRHLTQDAGIMWLTRVAGINPATSAVIQEWDARGPLDLEYRSDLLEVLRAEVDRRCERCTEAEADLQPV